MRSLRARFVPASMLVLSASTLSAQSSRISCKDGSKPKVGHFSCWGHGGLVRETVKPAPKAEKVASRPATTVKAASKPEKATVEKAPAKKATAAKPTATKPTAAKATVTKATVKKATATKATATKATVKKPAVKKPSAKKAPVKKPPVKKPPVKKPPVMGSSGA